MPPGVAPHIYDTVLPERPLAPAAAQPVAPAEAEVQADLVSLAAAIDDGNILGMPIATGRTLIAFWSRFLSKLPGREIAAVGSELIALDRELAMPSDEFNAHRLGQRLAALGFATRTIASERMGPLGFALDRLADGLIAAAQALDTWAN